MNVGLGFGLVELLPWHESVWQRLISTLEQDQLPHGLLVVGEPGVGKLSLAARLLNAMVCEHRNPSAPCGECHSCHLFETGAHPGALTLAPEKEQGTIGIDLVREAIHLVSLTSPIGPAKAVLINPADALTIPAANALLKTLEEPPGSTFFVLVTDHPSALPATIRSRCSQVHVPCPEPQQARPWLAGYAPGAEALLAYTSGGPLAAADLFEHDMGPWLADIRRTLYRLLIRRIDPVEAVKTLRQDGDPQRLLDQIQRMLHYLVRLKFQAPVPLSGQELQSWTTMVEGLEFTELFALEREVSQARRDLRSGSGLNQDLVLEALAARWRELHRGQPVH